LPYVHRLFHVTVVYSVGRLSYLHRLFHVTVVYSVGSLLNPHRLFHVTVVSSSLCSHIFLVLRDHWLYVCLHLKMEFRSCARGRHWCGIFHYHWWTASIKPRLLFSHSGLVSWGLPFLQFNTQLVDCHMYIDSSMLL